ncbi:hypothetical protein [Micromonospora carbonacea]|uniref:hypothetical protein n=1 Tax=Micromonospora carbonacea TaxID=47853 RepID=UPI0033FC75CE
MGAIKNAILADLPDPAEVQLWRDGEQIAQVLHETQTRIAVERYLLPRVRPWDELPAAVKACRVAACVELLERGIIAGPLPSA